MHRFARNNGFRFFAAAVATVLVWAVLLPLAASSNIRMDSDRMIYHPDSAMEQYLKEGRGGLVLILRLFGLDRWNPLRSGILFLLFFSVSCWLFTWSLARQTRWKREEMYLLFFLLYALSPIWAYHAYFTLQIAAVGFGMMLCTLLASADILFLSGCRETLSRRILREVLSLAVLSFSLTIYQALAVHYLTVLAVLLFCFFLRGGTCGMKAVLLPAARMLLAMAVYWAVARAVRNGSDSANLANQIRWGTMPISACLFRIVQEAGASLLLVHSRYFSLFPMAAVLGALLWFRRRGSPLLCTGICLLLLPFAFSLLLGNVTVPRAQFALQAVAAFLPVCYLAETEKTQRVLCIACAVTVVLQALLTVRLTYTDNVRNDADTTAARRILAELGNAVEGKPLAIIGTVGIPKRSLLTERADVFGQSFFEWNAWEERPGTATGPGIRLLEALSEMEFEALPDNRMEEAAQEAARIPAYPMAGFVADRGEYILIRLE